MDMFFRVLLTLMNKFPPIKGLTAREIEILAEFMYQNYKYKHVDIKKRHFLIFSTDNRIEMRTRLEISELASPILSEICLAKRPKPSL